MAVLVWLTENYPPQRGGMAQSCDRIVHNLRKRGHHIHIVHFSNRKEAFKTVSKVNGSYTAIPVEDSEAHILNLTWRKLEQFKEVDVLVCYGSHLAILGAPVFSKWFGWKLLTLIRGNDFDASLFTPRKRSAIKDLFRASSGIASVSSLKTRKISTLFPGSEPVTIPNGIDLSDWAGSPQEREVATKWRISELEGRMCIGLFGQLKAKKGGRFFLESLGAFSIKEQVHLLLAGEVEDDTVELLEKYSFSYSLLPFLDRYELIRWYLCCDLVAIPSFYDGMPNVLLEAGGLGIPVLASDTDGMSDVITDGTNGYLFAVGDMEDCRKKAYEALEDGPAERARKGKNLLEHIRTTFDHETESENYEKLINIIMGT